jgi:hypothetical protein
MRAALNILILTSIFLLVTLFPSCKSKTVVPEKNQLIQQEDINLFIMHKHHIDEITSKYDEKLSKSPRQDHKKIMEEGKLEINEYLQSNGLKPELFMQKSKKILKCYLAFRETDKSRIDKKRKELEEQNLSEALIDYELSFYENASKKLFKSYTKDLLEHEINLIKFNMNKIANVVDRKETE